MKDVMLQILTMLLLYQIILAVVIRKKTQSEESVCLSRPLLVCNLVPTKNSETKGKVSFTPIYNATGQGRRGPCQVRIAAKLTGLTPGAHGFHLHTYGDLSVKNGTAAGGHFMGPNGIFRPHGLPGDRRRHWGDLGNVVANKRGVANYERIDKVIGMRAIIGRSVVVHELEDGGVEFQPTGAAGGRLAHCVIGVANPDFL